MEKLTVCVREATEMLGIVRIRGPPIVVGLLVFKTCVSREIGTAEFDSQTLPPTTDCLDSLMYSVHSSQSSSSSSSSSSTSSGCSSSHKATAFR